MEIQYYIIFTIFAIVLLSLLILHVRKKRIMGKLCILSTKYKCELLNELVSPLGYHYDSSQDIFTSTLDAWQKDFGYGYAYDKFAPFFNMVFDSQPVYFDYNGRTWLVEFWKGQYGINTGAEIGIYHADNIIPFSERKTTIFSAANEEDYLKMSLELLYKGKRIAKLTNYHWWQTIFSLGKYSNPKDLSLQITITFPNYEMRNAFTESLIANGHCDIDTVDLDICYTDVSFRFSCKQNKSFLSKLHCHMVLWKNKFFCLLYQFVTRPYHATYDKLLYLYYYLPFAFRCTLRLKRFRKKSKKRR